MDGVMAMTVIVTVIIIALNMGWLGINGGLKGMAIITVIMIGVLQYERERKKDSL